MRFNIEMSSDGLPMAYQVMILIFASSIPAVMVARVVLPNPLLPENNRCPSGLVVARALWIAVSRIDLICDCQTNSEKL